MRVATFNILHGRSLADGRVDADRLRAAVAALDADVLALQEVDRGQDRSGRLDLAAIAAEAAGAVTWRFTPAVFTATGGGWRARLPAERDQGGPAYRVAMLSRYPVRWWREIRLPALPVRSPVLLPGSGRVRLLRDEPRVALVAAVEAPGGPYTVATTHLSFVPGWNAAQLVRLACELGRLPEPRVLLGDLNLPGSLPGLLTGWSRLGRCPTFPSPEPRVQLDHVLGSGRLPPVRSVAAPELELSDHRPQVVEFAR